MLTENTQADAGWQKNTLKPKQNPRPLNCQQKQLGRVTPQQCPKERSAPGKRTRVRNAGALWTRRCFQILSAALSKPSAKGSVNHKGQHMPFHFQISTNSGVPQRARSSLKHSTKYNKSTALASRQWINSEFPNLKCLFCKGDLPAGCIFRQTRVWSWNLPGWKLAQDRSCCCRPETGSQNLTCLVHPFPGHFYPGLYPTHTMEAPNPQTSKINEHKISKIFPSLARTSKFCRTWARSTSCATGKSYFKLFSLSLHWRNVW